MRKPRRWLWRRPRKSLAPMESPRSRRRRLRPPLHHPHVRRRPLPRRHRLLRRLRPRRRLPPPPPPPPPPPAAAPPAAAPRVAPKAPAAPSPTPTPQLQQKSTPSPLPTPSTPPSAPPAVQPQQKSSPSPLPTPSATPNAPPAVQPLQKSAPSPLPTPAAPASPTPTPQPPQKGTPTPVPTPVPGAKQLPPATPTPPAATTPAQPAPSAPPAGVATPTPAPSGRPGQPTGAPATPNAAPAPGGGQTALPPGAAPAVRPPPPTVSAPIPAAPPQAQALIPIAPGAAAPGPRRMDDFRGARQESDQGGRKVFTEPGRIIVVDPGGQSFIRHNEEDRFRYGARDIQTQQVGGETRTIVIRPDGSQIITISGRDGQMMRRIRRDREGREVIIIDNTYRDPSAVGGFYVDLPPPVIRIPYNRYIVEAEDAPPDLIYETMEAPPVDRIQRRYSLDEIRYSPSVRQLMPSIDLNSINFETGSWEIPPDQAAKLQAIADGLNRAISRNPREVFLIEGHTDAVGSDVDNLSLSDRRAESAAELLTQQFGVPAENLTSQGYGSQYLKEQTSGPSRHNRRRH